MTREKLLQAGEHLFARQGVDAALTRAIVSLAGQSNDSAITYHFGSRAGLLEAILERHMARIERRQAARSRASDAADPLERQVEDLVHPVSDELRSSDGRDFLRIIVQLAGDAGVRTHELPNPLRGTAVAAQLERIEHTCTGTLPEAVVLERLSMTIGMLTAALADRARRIDESLPVLLGHDSYVDNLAAMLAGALAAPDPASSRHDAAAVAEWES